MNEENKKRKMEDYVRHALGQGWTTKDDVLRADKNEKEILKLKTNEEKLKE